MKSATNSLVIVGKLGKSFGVKGWIKLYSYTDPFENILSYQPWLIKEKGQWHELKYEEYAVHAKQLIVKFAAFNTPETVKQLTNCEIAVERTQLPTLQENEYYWSDLENLQVYTLQNELLGEVDHILETGANPIIVIRGSKERLIPLVMGDIVKEVNIKQNKLIVDWDPSF